MTRTRHGGDVLTFREKFGLDPLDFSANVNPLGMAPSARDAAMRALDVSDRYPDPRCRLLKSAIAMAEGVPQERIVCGNGASDIIWRIAACVRAARAAVLAPTFSEYAEALAAAGTLVEPIALDEGAGLRATETVAESLAAFLDRDPSAPALAFICNPNNPTGSLAEPGTIALCAKVCEARGCHLVIDECFMGFTDDPDAASAVALLASSPHLAVLKAHTKIFGMAGLRLGYALFGSESLARRVTEAGPAWPVSTIAQAAGAAAFVDRDYLRKTHALIAAERPRVAHELALCGAHVYPSDANYLLVRAPSASFGERMAENGVLVRPCGNYRGLTSRHFRLAVRTKEENDRMLAAARTALAADDAACSPSPSRNGGLV